MPRTYTTITAYVNLRIPFDHYMVITRPSTLEVERILLRGPVILADEDNQPIIEEIDPEEEVDITTLVEAAACANALTFDGDANEVRLELAYTRFWEPGYVDHHHGASDPRNMSTDPCPIDTRRIEAWKGPGSRPVRVYDDGFIKLVMDQLEDEIYDVLASGSLIETPWLWD